MQSTNTTNAELQSIAGFNRFECHGSVLIWNNGTDDVPLTVSILQLPYQSFTVQVYQLNNDSLPGVSFDNPRLAAASGAGSCRHLCACCRSMPAFHALLAQATASPLAASSSLSRPGPEPCRVCCSPACRWRPPTH